MRSLAQRSAQAAKEIKALIGESVRQVEAGTEQVAVAGRKMEDIVASVQRVGELIAEIAAASQEQSSGIEQVNTAITQMDQVVQQNAALVEEAAAATQSMKDQSAALLEAVSRFRISETETAPRPAEIVPLQPVAPVRVTPPAAVQLPGWAATQPGALPRGEWREF